MTPQTFSREEMFPKEEMSRSLKEKMPKMVFRVRIVKKRHGQKINHKRCLQEERNLVVDCGVALGTLTSAIFGSGRRIL